jgi:hypothetical protein
MFAVMPIIIPMNTSGGGSITINELIFILSCAILICQYMMVFMILSFDIFYSKIRFFLNLIPFWFVVEFFIMIYNKLKEMR